MNVCCCCCYCYCCISVQIRSELQSQLLTLATEKENLRANESQIASRIRDTLQENDRLKNELTKTQKVTGEFRKECESLVGDYQTAAKKIELLEKERDRFRNQTDMGMRELAMRAERIKALEAERQSLQDQLQHMDLQVCASVCVYAWNSQLGYVARKKLGLFVCLAPPVYPSWHTFSFHV